MIDLKELLKAGVHFGHKASRWSPKMRPFIWGSRNKIHLIDIAKTAFLLERAGKYIDDITSDGGSILWIGTKKAAQKIIEDVAKSLDMPFVTNRWIGGTLTNFDQIRKAITRLLHLKDVAEKSNDNLTKKELSIVQKEIGRLEKNIGGILNLKFPPAAIVLVDAKKEFSAIKEAVHMHIPIIAMVDTNTNPSNINFIIPSNDDSPRSIACIIDYLGNCAKEGQKKFNAKKKETTEKKTIKKEKVVDKAEKVEKKAAPKKVEAKSEKTEKASIEKKVKQTKASSSEQKKKTTEKKTTIKKETTAKKKTTTKK